uniref:Cytochrome P450 2K1 n=1 Tax=Maylandia zebra TaxID=106582 RepID=A0A3P9BPF0_9CICH
MRVNGRAHTLLTLHIFWTKRVNLSGEMPSCPFLQVAGCVSEKVWLRWSSSSSSPPSFSAFVSLLHLESQRMNWISHQLWDSPPLLHLICCVLSLSKEYGSVFTLYFGTNKVVVLAGYETVREALVNYAEEFGERNISPILNDINRGHGILFANGESWKELRYFALTTLKDFASLPINYATANIIFSVVYGCRFDYNEPIFTKMVKRANHATCVTGSASVQLHNMFPRLFRWIKNHQVVLKNVETTIRDVKYLITYLKETLDPDMCQGFVDCFLIWKHKEEEFGIDDSHYSEENLIFTVIDLFVAGTDTTAATLRWGLLLMAKYPHIQEQVHEELRHVVGSRKVSADDRKNLPYTDAVIHEIQRLANILPVCLPHQTSRDVTFQGYFIKKGTIVFPLLTSVLYDESEWESPHTFNPSHFLDKEGKFVRRDAFMPFSAGYRMCLGEGLAKMELFLFFTSLVQRFCFTPTPGITEDELDLTPAVGFTTPPSSHKLCAVSRQ